MSPKSCSENFHLADIAAYCLFGGAMLFFTHSLRSTLFLLFMLFWPSLCYPGFEDFISINAPESVEVGQPFLIRLSSSQKLDDLEVFWNERSVRPSITTEKGMSHALVLLGTRLSTSLKDIPLEVQARIHGKMLRFHTIIQVASREYQREALSVDPRMITPPKRMMERIKSEREVALKAIKTMSPQRLWKVPFALPVKGKMLSRFGLHRVFNGESKRRHKGLDFRAYLGTPINSIAAGTVVLVGNFYYGGNCVYIDHGNGVISASAHLSQVLVQEGDTVSSGALIGLSGATGRATGAHLHLGVFVQGVSIDPEPLFNMNETCFK